MPRKYTTSKENTNETVSTIALVVWFFVAVKSFSIASFAYPLYAIVLFFILTRFIVRRGKHAKSTPTFSWIATPVLIGLTIHPQEGIGALTLAVVVAVLATSIRWKGNVLVHPAALGIVLSSLVLGFSVSWWGAVILGKFLMILLFVVYLLGNLDRAGRTGLYFLAGYAVFFLIIRGLESSILVAFDPTILLFSFVFLPDFETGENRRWWLLPLITLFFVLVSFGTKISFGDPLLSSLVASSVVSRFISLRTF